MPDDTRIDYDWPESDAAAVARYDKWKSLDPFPQIPPALLNSADIVDYVRTTGMIYPFREERDREKKLKPASYEVDLLGVCGWYDPTDEQFKQVTVQEGEPFVLKRNSIAFVQIEPRLRVPSYIALRFNLRIKHVYRGLLLGTGPLIDPQYQGPLFIPLHNLTANDYTLVGGDGLIWMEFTKLHVAQEWAGNKATIQRHGKVHPFPTRKNFKDLSYFLNAAEPGKAIRSSLPMEVARSADAAEKAAASARSLGNRISWGAAIAILTLILGGGALVISIMSFINDRAGDIEEKMRHLENRMDSLTGSPNSDSTHPTTLSSSVSTSSRSSDKVKK